MVIDVKELYKEQYKAQQEKEKFFTVIVPIYNPTIKYFKSCIISLISQAMADQTEFIFVDDASPSKEYKQILNDWFPENNYTLYELEENLGVGGSREYALERATGKWVTFVDQDDIIPQETFQKVKRDILKYDCKLVFHTLITLEYVDSGKSTMLNYSRNLGWLHGKFYNREELIKRDIHFHPTARSSEDIYFAGLVNMESVLDEDVGKASLEGQYIGYKWLIIKESATHVKAQGTDASYLERNFSDCTMVWKDSLLWGWNRHHNLDRTMEQFVNNIGCAYNYILVSKNTDFIKEKIGIEEREEHWYKMYQESTQWIKEVADALDMTIQEVYDEIFTAKYRKKFYDVTNAVTTMNAYCTIPTISFDDWFFQTYKKKEPSE